MPKALKADFGAVLWLPEGFTQYVRKFDFTVKPRWDGFRFEYLIWTQFKCSLLKDVAFQAGNSFVSLEEAQPDEKLTCSLTITGRNWTARNLEGTKAELIKIIKGFPHLETNQRISYEVFMRELIPRLIPLPPRILYNSDELLVVFKPPGIPVLPCQGLYRGCLRTLAAEHLGLKYLHPINRLDVLVSGLVYFAKTPTAVQDCANRTYYSVKKFYVAHTSRTMNSLSVKPPLTVSYPLTTVKHVEGTPLHSKVDLHYGKEASTNFWPIGERLYLCRPWTGRTHQIRVHLDRLWAPIVGDTLYGGEPSDYIHLHCVLYSFVPIKDTFAVGIQIAEDIMKLWGVAPCLGWADIIRTLDELQ